MLKNQRIYRFAKQKLHSDFLAAAVTGCADAVFYTALWITGLLPSSKGNENKTFIDESDKVEINKDYGIPVRKATDKSVDLSVVIPAYNAQKYIKQCVESVLNQKTEYNVQIIAVNDNSKDSTLDILKSFENIEVIDFKNGGSAAKSRNEGMRHATGKYIMFVDADDILAENAVDILLDCAEKNKADVVQGGWQYISEEDKPGEPQVYCDCEYSENNRLSCYDLPGTPWGKVYLRELFDKTEFPEKFTAFEDTVIHFCVLRSAKKICSVSPVVYYWRKNSEGITSTSQNTKRAIQSYYIVEQAVSDSAHLGLPDDIEFELCLISQLTNYCYVNIRNMKESEKRAIFNLCCALYGNLIKEGCSHSLPLYVRFGGKALEKKNMRLWKLHGEISRFMR